MICRSKLLDEDVVKFARASLKNIGQDALLCRKLEAVISAKKHGISMVAKV